MIFDTPLASILPADVPHTYCGRFSNAVEVGEATVYIRVPSDLFSLLSEAITLPPGPLSFYLDPHANGKLWVFGIVAEESGDCVDLWSYRDLPRWAV
jgi:hypothetical protein